MPSRQPARRRRYEETETGNASVLPYRERAALQGRVEVGTDRGFSR
jgi:hypothetical protein